MALNPFSRIKDGTLYPTFRAKMQEMYGLLAKDGHCYVMTSGLRTHKEQADLYAIGRTKPGTIKTKARAGFSPHNYGVAGDSAYDLNPDDDKLQPSWDEKHMKRMADAAKKVGLEAGYYWKEFQDGPHIQLPLSKYGITWAKLNEIFDKGGLKAVWTYLDKFKW